jgi:ElaB/YqjD/DUF883 family membrane-anchored ribosome-binding protein
MAEERLDLTVAVKDMATRALKEIKGSVKSIADKAEGFNKRLKDLQPTFTSMRNVGAVSFGTISAGLGLSVKAASDLSESINAVSVVFGEASEEVKKLGDQSAKTVGLSKTEFYGLAVQMSSFAKTVAGDGGSVSDTLNEMTVRIADFASVMNLEVADAAAAFQSGLAGQTEPLRKFGIDLSAASVQAYAVASGIAEAGKQMTESQRIQATYGSLMEQTAKTAGDFANTAGEAANRQRILKAEIADMSASLGSLYLPAWKQVLEAVTPVVSKLSEMVAEHPKLTVGVIGTVAALSGMAMVIGQLGKMLPMIITTTKGFGMALMFVTGQATLLKAAIVALPWAITIGVALAGFSVVMKQISELRRETDDAYDSKMKLEDLNQKAIDRAKELRASGDTEGADRILATVKRNVNSGIEARASGGPVSADTPYLVGEDGPELFVPRNAGRIVPNGNAGLTINNLFTFNGDVNDKDALKREIIDAINRQASLAMQGI